MPAHALSSRVVIPVEVSGARVLLRNAKEAMNLAEQSEEALCEEALRGHRGAWDVLITRHNHRVVVSLLARGLPIDRAKELAHDAWARLIEQQREGRLSHLSLPGLAITQASFLALDEGRRRAAQHRASGARAGDDALAAAAELPDPAPGAEERLLSKEQLLRAQDALSRCSPSAQRVFRLLYENPSMGHAQAAQQVGLSLQRVRQILCEVRKKLRVAIEEDVDE